MDPSHVKPGGWVEFQDYDMQYYSDDGSMKLDCPLAKWIGLSIKAAYDNRRDPSPGPKLEGWVRDAGFVDVHHERLKLPIGPWPKERNLVGLHLVIGLHRTGLIASKWGRKPWAPGILFRFLKALRDSP